MLTSPLWFPGSGSRFPSNAGDVALASVPCEKTSDQWKCRVHVGAEESLTARNCLGFSFLAVGDQGPTSPAVHGSVAMEGYDVDQSSSVLINGVRASATFPATGEDFSFYAGEGTYGSDSVILLFFT